MRDVVFSDGSEADADDRSPPGRRNSDPLIRVEDLDLWYDYGNVHALNDISMELYPGEVLAFIGPSGCGKSTMLKVFNRMHDMDRGVRKSRGGSRSTAADINAPRSTRRSCGAASAGSRRSRTRFPMSIWQNVSYGPRIHGLMRDAAEMEAHVEDCLRRAHLWDEVKDRLHDP
jgi:phosphate transport system ATP-binding protein